MVRIVAAAVCAYCTFSLAAPAVVELRQAVELVPRVLSPIVCAFGTALLPVKLLERALDLGSNDAHGPSFQSRRHLLDATRPGEGECIPLAGRLDEPFGQSAMPGTHFIMQEPTPRGTPTKRTEVWIVFERDDRCVGGDEPRRRHPRLTGNAMRCDDLPCADDHVMWTIDPLLDQQTGYFFVISPWGARPTR